VTEPIGKPLRTWRPMAADGGVGAVNYASPAVAPAAGAGKMAGREGRRCAVKMPVGNYRVFCLVALLVLMSGCGRDAAPATQPSPPQTSPAAGGTSRWGQAVNGLQAGITIKVSRAAAQGDLKVTGLLKNVGQEPVDVNTFPLGSPVLSVKVYRTRDADPEDHILTSPPTPPPSPETVKRCVQKLKPGDVLSFDYTLYMFSPELAPGSYWVEFWHVQGKDQLRSPRVEVQIVAPPKR